MSRWVSARVALGAVFLAITGLVLHQVWGGARPPEPRPRRAPVEIARCALGEAGAKVQFQGKIAEIHPDYAILLVRTDAGVLASVHVEDGVGSFTPGRPVQIRGQIREIRSPELCAVDATMAREL